MLETPSINDEIDKSSREHSGEHIAHGLGEAAEHQQFTSIKLDDGSMDISRRMWISSLISAFPSFLFGFVYCSSVHEMIIEADVNLGIENLQSLAAA